MFMAPQHRQSHMNQRVICLLVAGLLWIAPRALAVSEGAPPPPPTWRMGEAIDEPLTIPQEGVVVIRAIYETYGGFYGDATATYAVRVTNSPVCRRATWTRPAPSSTRRPGSAPASRRMDATTV